MLTEATEQLSIHSSTHLPTLNTNLGMERRKSCALLLHLAFLVTASISGVVAISRHDFPPGFTFGAGTSALQVEGAAKEDGKKPNIWDTFALAGKISETGDVAADQYHKYKEDVRLMHEMGLDAYRFSISWSRLIPDGRGPINPKGLLYYNNLINELTRYGIEAHVTLYHFDLPQALQDEYSGLLSPKIVGDFTAYADVCFREFGDRVKHWTTFNEPNAEAILGYDVGLYPPGRCSHPFGFNCSEGNSTTEPYLTAHNILLSHASAVKLYKEKYQAVQKGKIGITILAFWFEPFSDSLPDTAAAKRATDFQIGWFLHPLVYGTYPSIMEDIVGSRLPSISHESSEQLKGSFDFIGVNHYTTYYVQDYSKELHEKERDYFKDISVRVPGINLRTKILLHISLEPIVPPMPICPWGLQKVIKHIGLKYKNPEIIIHENGYGEFGVNLTTNADYDDADRTEYLQGYIENLLQSIRNGSNVKGYFVWSFLDCFELHFGYSARYGLYGVDFLGKDRKRYPRLSSQWYSNLLSRGEGSEKFDKIYTEKALNSIRNHANLQRFFTS